MAPSAAAAVPRYPAWVLLEKEGYDGDLDEPTSARCKAIDGRDVTVAFHLVPPPAVSYFCAHVSRFEDEDEDDLDFHPLFVFSAKGLVLFRFHFISRTDGGTDLVQYFVYRAGPGHPSLEPIPSTPLGSSRTDSIFVSIVPCGGGDDDDEEYVLADLSVGSEPGRYDLHIYSCKTCKWNTTPLQLPTTTSKTVCRCRDDNLPSQFHKVIGLGAGEVGWVDLWRGIVACKVLDDHPVLRLIPLPKPDVHFRQEAEPGLIRDVTYCNGLFKFIEIEEFCRPVRIVNGMIHDYAHIHVNGMAHDSTLIHVEVADEDILVNEGWKIRTCYRIDSCDFWFRAHSVHVDDITVDNLRQSTLFPHIWDARAEKSKFGKLTTFYPIFGIPGDDSLVYLLSKVKFDDNYTCIVVVDLEEKMVKLIEPCAHMGSTCIQPPVVSSAFSCYLNSSPGCFLATLTNHSDNVDHNAAIHGDSSVPELDIPFDPCLSSCAGEDTSPASGSWDSGENNLPQSHECADVQQTRLLQYLDSILVSSGSGKIHPTMTQELKTDADGNLWLSFPLDDLFSQLPRPGPELACLKTVLSRI